MCFMHSELRPNPPPISFLQDAALRAVSHDTHSMQMAGTEAKHAMGVQAAVLQVRACV